MSKTPTIGGIKMKKLGKGKPGRMKNLVKRHLGDGAAEKITKSDGAALMAKGKKTGNTELTRKGSFIKNMMGESMYKSPAHKRLQKLMDKNRKSFAYQNKVRKLGGTPLKPGEQNKLYPTKEEVGFPDDGWGTTKLDNKLRAATPGQTVAKAANKARKMREQTTPFAESREYQRTRELARAGLIGKKDLSKFEYIMRKMDNDQSLTQNERNFVAGIYDNLLKSIIKNPEIFTRFRAMARKGKFNEEFVADVNQLHEATERLAELEEKVLTKAEKKKREEVAQAIERDNPGMPMAKKMAIATATAKRVAEAKATPCGRCGTTHVHPRDGGKCPALKESPEAWKKWAKTAAGKRYAALSTKEKEAKAKRNRMNESCCDDCSSLDEELIQEDVTILVEGEKKNVTLNKIQRGGSKKFYVYTKNDKGNVVKVSFGDPGLSIKRDDPARRRSFRARHNCDNPGPKWKARYWSCRQWRASSKVEG